jgi:hypothetical protein
MSLAAKVRRDDVKVGPDAERAEAWRGRVRVLAGLALEDSAAGHDAMASRAGR